MSSEKSANSKSAPKSKEGVYITPNKKGLAIAAYGPRKAGSPNPPVVLVDTRPIIPILFLPNIMGSSLMNIKYQTTSRLDEEATVLSFDTGIEALSPAIEDTLHEITTTTHHIGKSIANIKNIINVLFESSTILPIFMKNLEDSPECFPGNVSGGSNDLIADMIKNIKSTAANYDESYEVNEFQYEREITHAQNVILATIPDFEAKVDSLLDGMSPFTSDIIDPIADDIANLEISLSDISNILSNNYLSLFTSGLNSPFGGTLKSFSSELDELNSIINDKLGLMLTPVVQGKQTTLSHFSKVFEYSPFNNLKTCQQKLEPFATKVYDAKLPTDFEHMQNFGWGTVDSSYLAFLLDLYEKLNNIAKDSELSKDWLKHAEQPLSDIPLNQLISEDENTLSQNSTSEKTSYKKLNIASLLSTNDYKFDIWAQGYNWLESNIEASKSISNFIDNTILPYYNNENISNSVATNKILLITHGMGGLVARHLNIEHKDKILGVIHGAIPANGTPEIYKTARSGQAIMSTSWGFGGTAEKFTATMLHCQGALELLVSGTGDYLASNKGVRASLPAFSNVENPVHFSGELQRPITHESTTWLWHYFPKGGFGANKRSLEALSNASEELYDKIYKSGYWYALLPDHNLPHFDPAGIIERASQLQEKKGKTEDKDKDSCSQIIVKKNSKVEELIHAEIKEKSERKPREAIAEVESKTNILRKLFNESIDKVKEFHLAIKDSYIENGYSLWLASKDFSCRGELIWETSPDTYKFGSWQADNAIIILDDDGTGNVEFGDWNIELKEILHKGDGSIPISTWNQSCVRKHYLDYAILNKDGKQELFDITAARELTWYFIIETLITNNIIDDPLKESRNPIS